jgi:predicted nuclease of predicted toxin-antitoxin system
MKILLDESLPRKLRNDFGAEHEVWTVKDMGWLEKKWRTASSYDRK